eukprot:CAMPEP_0171052446 /NCGR_PEP_ID=MMETSP0736-20130129/53761_1 /TAXON_ID=186038 /ORGANISM="Fragilariopsis kerguelensis, Strain L26-C5" /LENGTH=125 /DNA_ID=CAMNT_0011505931 /DNA_START=143 /DNA_END=523 /DNA_ORIENTATION=+
MPEEADWQHVNMVFKDALIIHYARIIDVTTLRDLHVGLPRGSFGFLFRGQRIGNPNNNLNTAPSDFNIGSDCGSLNSAFVDMQHDDVVAQSCSTNPEYIGRSAKLGYSSTMVGGGVSKNDASSFC